MKHVVIVGGGAALAQPLLDHYYRADWRVTAVCRRTIPAVCLSHPTANVQAVNSCELVSGGVDVLVTLPGSVNNGRVENLTDHQWRTVIENNLTSVCLALSRLITRVRDGGNVVVVGSVVGATGGRGCANYAAAKAGLVGLVRAAANENAARGVCVNLLELGYTELGMGARLPTKVREAVLPTIPLYRFGTAEDFVHAVEFLATTRYMTGGILTLAGGLR